MISIIRPARDGDTPIHPRCYFDEHIIDRSPGIARARNEGAKKSQGDILFFLDADSYVEGDSRWFENRTEDYWIPTFRCTDWGMWTRAGNAFFNTMNKLPPFKRFSWGHGSLLVVSREAFFGVGGYDETAGIEDVNILVRLWKAGYKFRVAPVTAVSIRRITFPPSRRDIIIEGHSGRLSRPMRSDV